jgi:hypothetical protein
MSPISLFTLVFLLVTVGAALWRGGLWERAVALALTAAWVVSALTPFDGVNLPWGAVLADGCVFLLLLYACLRSSRRWLLFAAAFQFLILATHYVFAMRTSLMQWAYVSAYYVWNVALIMALLVGSVWKSRATSSGDDAPHEEY